MKHLPEIPQKTREDGDAFNRLHVYNGKIPLAQNFICYSKANDKQGDNTPIKECVQKLPKALVYVTSEVSASKRNLFFPMALFAGQMFAVRYDGGLIVEEQALVQFNSQINSDTYARQPKQTSGVTIMSSIIPDFEEIFRTSRVAAIRSAHETFKNPYQIDFVTEDGLKGFLEDMESVVGDITTSKWPLRAVSRSSESQ